MADYYPPLHISDSRSGSEAKADKPDMYAWIILKCEKSGFLFASLTAEPRPTINSYSDGLYPPNGWADGGACRRTATYD